MSLRHSRYRRTGTQGLFNDSLLLFDRSPLPLYARIRLNRPLLGRVHLSLVATYPCAPFRQLPCLLTLSPDGSDQSLTTHSNPPREIRLSPGVIWAVA